LGLRDTPCLQKTPSPFSPYSTTTDRTDTDYRERYIHTYRSLQPTHKKTRLRIYITITTIPSREEPGGPHLKSRVELEFNWD
jgi:hypothetical protein